MGQILTEMPSATSHPSTNIKIGYLFNETRIEDINFSKTVIKKAM